MILGRTVEGLRKAIEYRELSNLFCRSLEDKNIESSADSRSLAHNISEGSKPLLRHLCDGSVVSGQLGLKNQL